MCNASVSTQAVAAGAVDSVPLVADLLNDDKGLMRGKVVTSGQYQAVLHSVRVVLSGRLEAAGGAAGLMPQQETVRDARACYLCHPHEMVVSMLKASIVCSALYLHACKDFLYCFGVQQFPDSSTINKNLPETLKCRR